MTCLGCKKEFIKDTGYEERIGQYIDNGISVAIENGVPKESLYEMPTTYFIPDKELYCDNCIAKINTVEDSVDNLLLKVASKNVDVNKKLDKYSEFFGNQSTDSEDDKEKFVFLFSYIEECFSLSSEIASELKYLFNRFEDHTVINFNNFSYMFYFRNVTLKSVSLIEKLTIFYSVAFNVEFRKNKVQNKYGFLLKQLRKIPSFQDKKFYAIMNNFRKKGDSFNLEDTRKSLDHDLSYNSGVEMIGVLDKIDIIYNLVCMCYDLFDEMITLVLNVYKNIQIPYDYTVLKYQDASIISVQYPNPEDTHAFSRTFGERVHQYNKAFLKDGISGGNPNEADNSKRVFDILNRLHEISRTHVIVNNLITAAIDNNWKFKDILIEELCEKNYDSLINDIIYRIYAVNDKLARLLVNKYNLFTESKYIYFDDFQDVINDKNNEQIIINNKEVFTNLDIFLCSKEYKFLTNNRNRIFHIRNDQNNFIESEEESFNIFRLNNIQEYYSYMNKIMIPILNYIN